MDLMDSLDPMVEIRRDPRMDRPTGSENSARLIFPLPLPPIMHVMLNDTII